MLGKYAMRPAVWILLGIPVLVLVAPFAVNHFWANLNISPKVSAEVRLKEQHRKCVIAEMAKGGKTRQAMIFALAAIDNRLKEVGEKAHDPDRDLRWYVLYHLPGNEYDGGKTRTCRFIYEWQGTTGPWMHGRIREAEAIFDRYLRKEDVFDYDKYPDLRCVTRITPYVAEVQEVKIPLLGRKKLWKTPGDPDGLEREMRRVAEIDGSRFYCPK